ncbi:MAG: efflux RND transporter periplasmic adaptor subunit [bacterium]|nr:efflux RND transporter periplasmic adaptor subunit [bacterium]
MSHKLALNILMGCTALAVGWWGRGLMAGHETLNEMKAGPSEGSCSGGEAPLYWRAPMDPTYVRDEPGKSPMGMDLVPVCADPGKHPSDGAVEISPQTVQNIGVRTEMVSRRDLRRSIRALGRVAYDETRVAHVHAKVQGWVEALHVDFVGQQVRKGQPLLEVYSPELVATQEELLLAARYRNATKDSPFEDVRGGGASLHEATRRRLELWDISERDIDRLLETREIQKTLTLHAPTSGVVTELGVRSGMEVGPNQNLYTIADVGAIWVRADVYEYELPWLSLGQIGVVELAYLPGKILSGPLTYISPFLDPKTRTAEVRVELSNPDGELRPGMFGNTVLQGSPLVDVIAIPSEAVIRSGRRSLVIRALGEGRFEPRNVSLGMDSGDGWLEITDGLEAGDEIVVSSQFLIDSESNLQQAVQKMLAAPERDEPEVREGFRQMRTGDGN